MASRPIMALLFAAFLVSGCAAKKYQFQGSTLREYRLQRIQARYPQWDEATVFKVASRRVEIGMTGEMVLATMGEPDRISLLGDEETWGYAVIIVPGDGPTYKRFVYFVHFKDHGVVRTSGDRNKLPHLYWSR